jgi:membrane protein DedA with SNARE-associated domain
MWIIGYFGIEKYNIEQNNAIVIVLMIIVIALILNILFFLKITVFWKYNYLNWWHATFR